MSPRKTDTGESTVPAAPQRCILEPRAGEGDAGGSGPEPSGKRGSQGRPGRTGEAVETESLNIRGRFLPDTHVCVWTGRKPRRNCSYKSAARWVPQLHLRVFAWALPLCKRRAVVSYLHRNTIRPLPGEESRAPSRTLALPVGAPPAPHPPSGGRCFPRKGPWLAIPGKTASPASRSPPTPLPLPTMCLTPQPPRS